MLENRPVDTLFQRLLARLDQGLVVLPDKPDETPERVLRALWHTAAGQPCSAELAVDLPLASLQAEQCLSLATLVDRRLAGEPLAYITGRQRFLGLDMLSSPEALIPRVETEQLARAAIELLATMPGELSVVDVCTGSGNIAYAIAHQLPQARVFGGDLSEQALRLADRNGRHLGMDGRVEFRCGDLLAPFAVPGLLGQIDLITSAPPYIESA